MIASFEEDSHSINIAIVGAGAMGSIYAAFFAEAGHHVCAVDTWAEHVDAIAENGLRVQGPDSDRIISNLQVATSFDDAQGVAYLHDIDLFIIATKGDGVAAAAESIAKVKRADSLILTIQNGLGAAERIAACMPADNVVLGVAEGFGAAVVAPGHVMHSAMKMIRLGEISGGMSKRLQRLEGLWQAAGFNAVAFTDIQLLIWEKFVCNVALSGPCALFDCTIGELQRNEESRIVSLGCMREAYQLGLEQGIAFSFSDPVCYLDNFVAAMPDSNPSLQQDFRAGRLSEIDAINGMVPVLGKLHQLDTPYNSTVVALVRSLEQRRGLRD